MTREDLKMTGWTFTCIVIGVTTLTAQLFRLIDYIDRPAGRRKA